MANRVLAIRLLRSSDWVGSSKPKKERRQNDTKMGLGRDALRKRKDKEKGFSSLEKPLGPSVQSSALLEKANKNVGGHLLFECLLTISCSDLYASAVPFMV